MEYRHEIKYLISLGEAEFLATRLRLTLSQDPHAVKNGGTYFIRSLYFDTPFEKAVGEKADGVEFRDKYRIRIYDMSDKVIKFERKHKNGQFIGNSATPSWRGNTASSSIARRISPPSSMQPFGPRAGGPRCWWTTIGSPSSSPWRTCG